MSTFYGLGSGDEASFNLLSKIENQADHVIRFAFSLTLNNEDAEKLCQETFKEAVQKGLGFWDVDARQLRTKLCRLTWNLFNSATNKKEVTSYDVSKLLGQMDIKTRTVLTLVDAMGIDTAEVFQLVGITDKDGRDILAKARQQLVNFKF